MNEFIKNGLKKAAETESGNGALKYSTSLNVFVDDFSSMGLYLNRSYEESASTIQKEWLTCPEMALKMLGYLRIITRKETHIHKTKSVQRGQGLRKEYIHRMMWLASNHPETFYKNIDIFVEIGSPRDIFALLRYDFIKNGWQNRELNWNKMYEVIISLLENDSTRNLVLKFMPTPRTNSKATTDVAKANNVIARWISWKMFPANKSAMKEYRKLKASGTAHTWQRQIAEEQYQDIDFDKVPSGALTMFTHPRYTVHKLRKTTWSKEKKLTTVRSDGTTFLERHNLEDKFIEWLDKQEDVNTTEYPHIILKPLYEVCPDGFRQKRNLPRVTEVTVNKKFERLLNVGKDGVNTDSRLIAVRDTSGSMSALIPGQKFSANHVAKSLALYLSQFLDGPFKDAWIEFNHTAQMHIFKGSTTTEKYLNDASSYVGNTDFLKVANIFVSAKQEGISESEMPTGIVCFSDGEFDPVNSWRDVPDHTTNFHAFLGILRQAGFSEEYVNNFQIILWDIPNGYYGKPSVKFEDSADAPNFFYISGYDPAVISFLMGGEYEKKQKKQPKTAEELMQAALDQEILDKLFV
ncbi:DUF2828 family protein [Lachnospira sp.]|jgi:hypothetical protein|uniref:DUF2828 family protein n=1 Tax=Lachnospira sp. TaxID=2049031 RepID=UPI00257E95E1|nr:DUF2828 family protein [Lachnospira sp.]